MTEKTKSPHCEDFYDHTSKVDCPRIRILRHIETVRTYLDFICIELLKRGVKHDQSKLGIHETNLLNPKYDLRTKVYGSKEYERDLKELYSDINHHYSVNRHHPEHFKNGMQDMNLIDILEMFVDWYASVKRHNEGSIENSIEYTQKKFKYPNYLVSIFKHTAELLDNQDIYEHSGES